MRGIGYRKIQVFAHSLQKQNLYGKLAEWTRLKTEYKIIIRPISVHRLGCMQFAQL